MKKLLVLLALYLSFAQAQDMSWLAGEWQGQYMNPSFTLLFSFAESGRLVVTALQDGKLAATEVGTWELQDDGLHLTSNFFAESIYGFTIINEERLTLIGTFAGASEDPLLDTLSLQKTNGQPVTMGTGEVFDGSQLVGRWQQPGSPYILTLHPDNSYQLQIDNNEVPPGERGLWSLAGGQFRLIADSDDLLVFNLSSFSASRFTLLPANDSDGDEIIFEKVP